MLTQKPVSSIHQSFNLREKFRTDFLLRYSGMTSNLSVGCYGSCGGLKKKSFITDGGKIKIT